MKGSKAREKHSIVDWLGSYSRSSDRELDPKSWPTVTGSDVEETNLLEILSHVTVERLISFREAKKRDSHPAYTWPRIRPNVAGLSHAAHHLPDPWG